jgi:tetratricopeptide (TPR) repeat protein
MASDSRINIVSGLPPEFNTDIRQGNVTYHVQTEDMGEKSCKLVTRVYRKGEVVFSRQSSYVDLAGEKDSSALVTARMREQHDAVARDFLWDRKMGFIAEAEKLLRRGGGTSALNILKEALLLFPGDPLLRSYQGLLVATVDKKPAEGIRICREAMNVRGGLSNYGSGRHTGVFYLNLGKAYLRAGDKSQAIMAFRDGLKRDPGNKDLIWEIKKMGVRRDPPIPFLGRGNPFNKYLGLLLSRLKGR